MAKDKNKLPKADKVLMRARKFFERAESAESEQRALELDDIKFVGLLEQWPEAIKRIREQDPQGARPCLTVDKVNQYKNQITNNIRMNTPSIKVRPVDDAGDEDVAEVFSGIVRHIETCSHADDAYDWASEGAVDSGIGYFRIMTEYNDDSFDQEIYIKKIANRFSVYRDPDSVEVDGSDQMECLITEFVRRDKFEADYPNATLSDWPATTGDDDRWLTDHEVRVAEYFYITEKDDELLLLADGNTVYKSEWKEEYGEPIKSRPSKKRVVNWAKVSGGDVLEETTFEGDYIPVIPVMGIVTVVDGKLNWRGIVRGAKDPQRMYNYNRSTIAENLGLTIKAPYIGATGQFETHGDKWAQANSVNFAYLEYDPVTTDDGVVVGAPQRQAFAGVPTGLMQDIQVSEHDIQAGMGMYNASLGQDGEAKSGRALNAQQRQGDLATYHFPDNLAKSVRHAGRIIVNIIPKYYDTQRVIRILGEDDSQEFVSIDPTQPEPFKKMRDEAGNVRKIYNLGVGKYDVVATTGASFATKRQEGAEFLTQVAQSSPDLMPIIGDLLFKSMDMPYADEVAERLKKMLPPELQEDEGDDIPEVQQVKKQAQQIIQGLTQQIQAAEQAMQEAEQEAQELKASAENKEDETALKAKEVEIKAFEAETKRLALQKDAVQVMMDSPLMPEFMTQNTQMMENLAANVMQALEQNQVMMAEMLNGDKEIVMTSPSGEEYRGVKRGGQVQIQAPSGEVYDGTVN